MVTLADLDSVYVMIYVTGARDRPDQARRRRPRSGSTLSPARPFAGRITYISPEAEFTPKNVQTKEDRVKLVFGVKVEIENRDGLLKPGLPADAVDPGRPGGR
ncbi:MAG: hypothetical protein MZV64_22895 [Ignavibacteriales bacterium]|nr:hypothetical protein [Ignavibacteriales bacterium]